MTTGVDQARPPADGSAPVDGMDPDVPDGHIDRARALLTRIVNRIGGIPAVKTLFEVFDAYDGVGGGLAAAGLAYAALFALVPGLLLVMSVVGLVVKDPAVRDRIVEAIARAFPPLAGIAEAAVAQVSAGAVPTGIAAFAGLLWGSSRLYASMDYAFTKIFRTARRRDEVERSIRGLLVSVLFIALPIVLVIAGSTLSFVRSLAPELGGDGNSFQPLLEIAAPLLTLAAFILGLMLVYRFVPTVRPPARAILPPALLAGTVIAIFTQLFAFIAPRMLGWAALFGALVTVFALLIWLSISLNVMLFGACWTRVRWTASLAGATVIHDAQPVQPAGEPSSEGASVRVD